MLIKVPKYEILWVAFEEYFNGVRESNVIVVRKVDKYQKYINHCNANITASQKNF